MEVSPLADPESVELEEVPGKDIYAAGMSVEDAYRHLSNTPKQPIDTDKPATS